jgi:UDP-glucose 4-epimerase
LTHVQDAVRGLMALAESPKAVGQVFNIGSGNEISIEALAKLVKKMTKSSSRIQKIPYDKAYEEGFEDMARRVPDIHKIHRTVGYKPTFAIRDILSDVIEHMRERGVS